MAAEDSPALPLKRYEFHDIEYGDPAYMGETSEGDYVLYTDTQSALAGKDAQIAEREEELQRVYALVHHWYAETKSKDARIERLTQIIEDYADHQRPACRDLPAIETQFCYCGLTHALYEAKQLASTEAPGAPSGQLP